MQATSVFEKPDQSTPLIQCFHIYKEYVEGQEIFRDASLQVNQGDFLFVLGPSGSGKSTLLKLILGLEPINRGHILVEGRNLQRLSRHQLPHLRRRIGVVFQDLKLLQRRSLFDNVAVPLEIAGKTRVFIHKKVHQALRLVRLDHKMGSLCRQLSGDERRRAAIARAIVNDPLFVLADDPTAGLEHTAIADIIDLFRNIFSRGTAVILATRDHTLPGFVPESRVAAIRDGRIVQPAFSPDALNED